MLENLLEAWFSNKLLKKGKTLNPLRLKVFRGAARQIRTADLILTKDALYLLSYSSVSSAGQTLELGDAEGT